MTQDIVTLYVTLLSQFFTLSSSTHSPVIASNSGNAKGDVNAPPPLPAFVPPTSNALTISHWLLKTLAELTECVNDIGGLEMAGEASASLKELVGSARWKFEEAVCGAWVRGKPSIVAALADVVRRCQGVLPSRDVAVGSGRAIDHDLSSTGGCVPEIVRHQRVPHRRRLRRACDGLHGQRSGRHARCWERASGWSESFVRRWRN